MREVSIELFNKRREQFKEALELLGYTFKEELKTLADDVDIEYYVKGNSVVALHLEELRRSKAKRFTVEHFAPQQRYVHDKNDKPKEIFGKNLYRRGTSQSMVAKVALGYMLYEDSSWDSYHSEYYFERLTLRNDEDKMVKTDPNAIFGFDSQIQFIQNDAQHKGVILAMTYNSKSYWLITPTNSGHFSISRVSQDVAYNILHGLPYEI